MPNSRCDINAAAPVSDPGVWTVCYQHGAYFWPHLWATKVEEKHPHLHVQSAGWQVNKCLTEKMCIVGTSLLYFIFRSVWFVYLRSVLSASVIVLHRFSKASRRCGSSFRNFTASTSTLSTTRILLCRLGNWSARERESERGRGDEEGRVTGRQMKRESSMSERGVWIRMWGRTEARSDGGKDGGRGDYRMLFPSRLSEGWIFLSHAHGGFRGRPAEGEGRAAKKLDLWGSVRTIHSQDLKRWTLSSSWKQSTCHSNTESKRRWSQSTSNDNEASERRRITY